MTTLPAEDLIQFEAIAEGSMNNLRGLAYRQGQEIRKLRRSPAKNRPQLAGRCIGLQGEADAALGK